MGDEIKAGARNSRADRERIRRIRAALADLVDFTRELEPDDEDPQTLEEIVSDAFNPDKALVCWGEPVKATRTDDGLKVAGYLVRFGGKDLTGEYFDADTDYDLPEQVGVYFHHGMDGKVGKRRLSRAQLTQDDIGVWAETILQERDEYEKFIAELAEAGKLGWSSGTVSHLMDREEQADGRTKITRWPIAEASLTHTPAEPRNMVMPLKSLIPEAEAPLEVAPTVEETIASTKSLEVKMELTAEEIKAMVTDAAKSAVEAYRESEPATTKAGVAVSVTKDAADQPFKNAGEFFQRVKLAGVGGDEDIRLRPLKATGMSEGVPADGGYLVPPAFAAGVQQVMFGTGSILSRINMTNVTGNSMTWNLVDETSRASTRRGGLVG